MRHLVFRTLMHLAWLVPVGLFVLPAGLLLMYFLRR